MIDEAIAAARIVADLLLMLVPHDTAKELLDDAAIRRANLAADLAEKIKFDQDADTEPTP